MKRRKKRTFRHLSKILLILVMTVICAIVALGAFANRALDAAVETTATKALGTTVTISDTDLSIRNGQFEFHDLTVSNPEGYRQEIFLTFKHIKTKVKLNTILKDVLRIDHLHLSNIRMFVEQKGLTTNLQEVVSAIEQGLKNQTYPYAKKISITELVMDDIAVEMQFPSLLGKLKPISFTLAPITLNDLGNEGELNVGTLIGKIILALVTGVMEEGIGVLPNDLSSFVAPPG